MEPVYHNKCLVCNRVLGDMWLLYRTLHKEGISHDDIMSKIGVREPCCLESLDLKCGDRYRNSLIRRHLMTDGCSQLVAVAEFSYKLRPRLDNKRMNIKTIYPRNNPQTLDSIIRNLRAT